MLLPVWLLTKKPLDTPRKYNLRITATMTVDGKEKKMSNEDVEVKLQPSANAVGSVVLSRVAAQERMEGVEELDDADPIDLRTGEPLLEPPPTQQPLRSSLREGQRPPYALRTAPSRGQVV